MSHPRSDSPHKDGTENSSSDATKRTPKRPRSSKRPMNKTIGFEAQSQGSPDANVPRMGEQDLWKALDGAITQATKDEATTVSQSKKRSRPPKRSVSSKKEIHKTQLGMPAISPVTPSKPKPISLKGAPEKKPATDDSKKIGRDTKVGSPQSEKKPADTKAPQSEAFMKTIAQAPFPTAEAIEEPGTEMLSADELLEIETSEEEEDTNAVNTIPKLNTISKSRPIDAQDATQDSDPPLEDIELTTLPPDLAEENEPAEDATAKTERLVSPGPTLNVATETTAASIHAEKSDEAEESIIVEDTDESSGEVPLLYEEQNLRKTGLLVGGIAAVILGVLVVVFFVFIKPYFFSSSAVPVASSVPASQAEQAGSGQNRPKTAVAAINTPSVPPAQFSAPIPAGDSPQSDEIKNNIAQESPRESTPPDDLSPTSASSGKKTAAPPREEAPPDKKASPKKEAPPSKEPSPSKKTPPKKEASPSKKAPSKKETPPSKDDPPAKKPVPAQDDAAAETEKADTGASTPKEPGMVTITLNGIPTGATIRVNGQTVERRFTVPKSEDAIKVEVKRTGFKTKVKRVIPLRDKQIRIKLKKIQSESTPKKS